MGDMQAHFIAHQVRNFIPCQSRDIIFAGGRASIASLIGGLHCNGRTALLTWLLASLPGGMHIDDFARTFRAF